MDTTMNNTATGAAACVGAPSAAGVSQKPCSASAAEMRSVLVWVERVYDRDKNSQW